MNVFRLQPAWFSPWHQFNLVHGWIHPVLKLVNFWNRLQLLLCCCTRTTGWSIWYTRGIGTFTGQTTGISHLHSPVFFVPDKNDIIVVEEAMNYFISRQTRKSSFLLYSLKGSNDGLLLMVEQVCNLFSEPSRSLRLLKFRKCKARPEQWKLLPPNEFHLSDYH